MTLVRFHRCVRYYLLGVRVRVRVRVRVKVRVRVRVRVTVRDGFRVNVELASG
jgi:hypothetical protein